MIQYIFLNCRACVCGFQSNFIQIFIELRKKLGTKTSIDDIKCSF